MATKKDLVEAHAFSRRRLVTAFLSGAPGGREVEPARPGRTIVGGLALAVLLVAAAAIASVLALEDRGGLEQGGPGREPRGGGALRHPRGRRRPRARPDPQHHLGPADPRRRHRADVRRAGRHRAADARARRSGSSARRQTLPRPDRFIEDGWTACTGDGRGIMLGLRTDAGRRAARRRRAGRIQPGPRLPRRPVGRPRGRPAGHALPPAAPTPGPTPSTRCSTSSGCASAPRRSRCPRTGCSCSRPAASSRGRRSASSGRAPTRGTRGVPAGRPGRRLLGRRRRGPRAHRQGPMRLSRVRAAGLPVQPGPGEEARRSPAACRACSRGRRRCSARRPATYLGRELAGRARSSS